MTSWVRGGREAGSLGTKDGREVGRDRKRVRQARLSQADKVRDRDIQSVSRTQSVRQTDSQTDLYICVRRNEPIKIYLILEKRKVSRSST